MSLSYTDALVELSTKIGSLSDCVQRQEEILAAIRQINGNVRGHGEVLAAQKQWVAGHEQRHENIDSDQRRLSARVWALGGGSGILAAIAMLLQALGQ